MAIRFFSPRFVGRAVELDRLEDSRARAAAGPAVVVVGGEAGVGKTRLVEEFARRCEAEGARTLIVGCIELGEEGVPFAPVIQALRTMLRLEPETARRWSGHDRTELARLLPELGLAPAGDGQAVGPELTSAQGRLFELLLDLLERVAGERPTVLVVEDLHWADQSTRDLLAFLVRSLRRPGLLLVLTYRADELHRRHPLRPFLAELERIGWVERIELARFDRAELTVQLTGILEELPGADLVDDVFERGQGNPFFTEELVAASAAGLRGQLPPTLRDTLMARIETLPDRTQHLLRVAATAGRQVEHDVLAEVACMPEAELFDALRQAISSYVLVADNQREAYAFRHALVQEAVYSDLLPGERVRLHAAYARTLAARKDDVGGCEQVAATAELAHHWYAAHDLDRALPAAITAGLAAERVYAYAEAQRQFERALELWERSPAVQPDLDRVDLLGRAAEAAFRVGSADRAVALIRSALKQVDAQAEPLRAGVLTARLANFLRSSGKQGAVAAYDEAIRLVPPAPPTPERAQVLAGLGQALMLKPTFEQARAVCEEAIAVAQASGARAAEGHARDTLGVVLAHLGDPAAGLANLEEALRIAYDLHEHHGYDVDDALRAHANVCDLFDLTGELERAAATASRGAEVAREHGLERSYGTWLAADAAAVLIKLGRWDEAHERLRAVLPQATSGGGLVAINLYQTLATLEAGRGELDLAVDHLRSAMRLSEKVFVGAQHIGPLHREQAAVAVWQAHHAQARSAVADGLSACLGVDGARYAASLYPVGLRAEADAAERARARHAEDEEADASQVAAELLDGARSLVTPWGPEFGAHLAACEAEWTRVIGEPDPERWQTVVDAWDKAGQPYPAAYARWRLAEALLVARVDREEAERALRDAHATAAGLGARPLRHELERLARRSRTALANGSGTSRPTGEPGGGFGLTRRELEVLRLVAEGRSNRQIAEELFISAKTASVHVSNILAKLDVGSRVEAAAVAHRLALFDAAPAPGG